jgi:hypothetical protein
MLGTAGLGLSLVLVRYEVFWYVEIPENAVGVGDGALEGWRFMADRE